MDQVSASPFSLVKARNEKSAFFMNSSIDYLIGVS
jgi:hypothetical protein